MELLLKERICFQRERILSFKSSSLRHGKSLLPHKVSSIECYYFYYARAYTAQWALRQCLSGHRSKFPNNDILMSLKFAFSLANSADPHKMPLYAAFHLGLHFLLKYLEEKGLTRCILLNYSIWFDIRPNKKYVWFSLHPEKNWGR